VRELTKAEQTLKRDMEMMREMKSRMGSFRPYVYCGMEDFLLQHGKWYTPRPLPPNGFRGARKSCFGNAIYLAAQKDYRYVEGLALNGEINIPLPIHHGWNIDADGNLIESTWPYNENHAYIGVEFSLGRADHATWEDDATVLDNPRNRQALYTQIWHGEDWKKVWPESDALKALRAAWAGDLSLIAELKD
jgi:hypothetical protein